MAKEIVKKIKLQIPAGAATPAPPVGTVLGPAGINLAEFCQKYNAATQDKKGDIIPVEIYVYDDRSYSFELKTPPAAELIKKFAKGKWRRGPDLRGRRHDFPHRRRQKASVLRTFHERHAAGAVLGQARDLRAAGP